MNNYLYCYDGPHGQDPHGRTLNISDEDLQSFRDLPLGPSSEWAAITDLDDGQRYFVRREECGASCYCAARAIPEGGVNAQ